MLHIIFNRAQTYISRILIATLLLIILMSTPMLPSVYADGDCPVGTTGVCH